MRDKLLPEKNKNNKKTLETILIGSIIGAFLFVILFLVLAPKLDELFCGYVIPNEPRGGIKHCISELTAFNQDSGVMIPFWLLTPLISGIVIGALIAFIITKVKIKKKND